MIKTITQSRVQGFNGGLSLHFGGVILENVRFTFRKIHHIQSDILLYSLYGFSLKPTVRCDLLVSKA